MTQPELTAEEREAFRRLADAEGERSRRLGALVMVAYVLALGLLVWWLSVR